MVYLAPWRAVSGARDLLAALVGLGQFEKDADVTV
jgi:hypothetical protein